MKPRKNFSEMIVFPSKRYNNSMLRKKVNTMAMPPMVGVGFLWEDRPLGMSMTRVYLIRARLMMADTINNAMAKIMWHVKVAGNMEIFYLELRFRSR